MNLETTTETDYRGYRLVPVEEGVALKLCPVEVRTPSGVTWDFNSGQEAVDHIDDLLDSEPGVNDEHVLRSWQLI